MKLKIGEFARLGQVSIQALRYYDSLGILVPCDVDPFSGYRYYNLQQLPRLLRVLALKDLGLSLEQVGRLLDEDLPPIELRRLLLLKQGEVRQQVQDQLDRLERIDTRLKLIDSGISSPAYEVIVKTVEPYPVASVRGVIPTFWDVTPLWERLQAAMAPHRLESCAPYLTLCHSSDPQIDVEVCAPIPSPAVPCEGLSIRTLPAETMACTFHPGPFTGLMGAFTALMTWIDTHDYTIVGPDREIYLRLPQEGQYRSDVHAMTELQIPIHRMMRTV